MAKITILQNGPILIEGTHEVFYAQSGKITDDSVKAVTAICRCGQTKNSPFCDGAHATCGFNIDTK